MRLGEVLGIEVAADRSWLAIASVLLVAFAVVFRGWLEPAPAAVATFAVTGAVLASIVMHELAHALVARRLGMEVVGITLFVFGGIAHLRDHPSRADHAFAVALAGPLANLLVGGLLIAAPDLLSVADPLTVTILTYLGVFNAAVGLFNLLPGHPLDGGVLVRSAVWARTGDPERGRRAARRCGLGLGVVTIAAGVSLAVAVSVPDGLYLAAVGGFLLHAARQAARLHAEPDSDTVPAET
ncbi:MAG: site-2 protease family protein [Actinobacteria bacterium]|nr:site-2 protease family protein [Actinomycetota bacterium]